MIRNIFRFSAAFFFYFTLTAVLVSFSAVFFFVSFSCKDNFTFSLSKHSFTENINYFVWVLFGEGKKWIIFVFFFFYSVFNCRFIALFWCVIWISCCCCRFTAKQFLYSHTHLFKFVFIIIIVLLLYTQTHIFNMYNFVIVVVVL